MAERTLDEQAAAVAKAVRDAFRAVLDDRLAALVIHGSAVTGYIPRFSDFDFEAFLHGPLRPEDALDIGARLQRVELGPFAYLQLSRVIDVDDPGARMAGLIDDAYAVACGALPATWAFHSEAVLRERGREAIERIPSAVATCVEDATTARGDRHYRVVRYLATVLKPALRGLLAECSEPVLDVWRAPHDDLAE
jgi:hypothetical protein